MCGAWARVGSRVNSFVSIYNSDVSESDAKSEEEKPRRALSDARSPPTCDVVRGVVARASPAQPWVSLSARGSRAERVCRPPKTEATEGREIADRENTCAVRGVQVDVHAWALATLTLTPCALPPGRYCTKFLGRISGRTSSACRRPASELRCPPPRVPGSSGFRVSLIASLG